MMRVAVDAEAERALTEVVRVVGRARAFAEWFPDRPDAVPLSTHQTAAAARAATSRAAKAMFAGEDGPLIDGGRIDVPKKQRPAVAPLEVEHLVEVAIVQGPIISYANQIPAHDTFRSRWIKCINQFRHVRFIQFRSIQEMLEAIDRHVRNDIETVEHQSKAFHQLHFELRLDRPLIRRQVGADRIVHKMQR